MIRFNGTQPIGEIIANFGAHLFSVDRTEYDQNGSDFVAFRHGWIDGKFIDHCLVCPFNGRFICNPSGRLDPESLYTERDGHMDGTSWYDELLGMIYVPTEGESK